jgi:hypothetical protein
MKIKLTNQQNDFVEVQFERINDKWFFYNKVLKKIGINEFEEVEIKDVPEGIKKYINEKKSK